MPSKRVFDHIRERLYEQAGLSRPRKKAIPSLSQLREECWSEEFETYMRNRLILGSARYETWADKRKMGDSYDYPKYIDAKVQQYRETGNLECLVDAANGCLLEFVFGSHPKRHFEAVDDNPIHCELKEE